MSAGSSAKKMAPSVFLQLSYKFLINRDHNENADTTFVMASGAVATVCYLFLGEEKKNSYSPCELLLHTQYHFISFCLNKGQFEEAFCQSPSKPKKITSDKKTKPIHSSVMENC